MTPPSIPRQLSGEIVDDFARLRDEALNWLARWCAASPDSQDAETQWSDFNVHDPGVQILEVISYALTELAYRAGLPVLTLLQDEHGRIDWNNGALFAPPDILPMSPLTAADYQKLLLDSFPQVSRVCLSSDGHGRYSVTLYVYNTGDDETDSLGHSASELLEQHRNLGENFAVRIMPAGSPDTGVSPQTCASRPAVTSIAENKKAGGSLADIFTGPLLVHGAISDESLKRGASGSGTPAHDQTPPPGPSTKLLRSPGWTMPRPDANWSRQALAEFVPLQEGFPANYALGAGQLPTTVTPLRQAQVRQLRGYLLHFEQLMRNYLAQLAHLPDLLSVRPQKQTFFDQTVDEVPEVMPLLKGYNAGELSLDSAQEAAQAKAFRQNLTSPYRCLLGGLHESGGEFLKRRHQFLDHLLARFGESFAPAHGATYETIDNKQSLLTRLPELGMRRAAGRVIGINFGEDERESALEEKITILLRRDHQKLGGPLHPKFYYLVEHGLLTSPDTADDRSEAFMLTHVFVNWTANSLDPDFQDYVEALVGENVGAHLLNHFHWFESGAADPGQDDSTGLRSFLALHDRWRLTPEDVDTKTRLLDWLRQQQEKATPIMPAGSS